MTEHPTKITFAEMRDMGVRGLLVYCADYRCSHSIAVNGDPWPDDLWLSDIEAPVCLLGCGKRGADVRPDFNWNKTPVKWAPLAAVAAALISRRPQANE